MQARREVLAQIINMGMSAQGRKLTNRQKQNEMLGLVTWTVAYWHTVGIGNVQSPPLSFKQCTIPNLLPYKAKM